jgi:hypothetical protein
MVAIFLASSASGAGLEAVLSVIGRSGGRPAQEVIRRGPKCRGRAGKAFAPFAGFMSDLSVPDNDADEVDPAASGLAAEGRVARPEREPREGTARRARVPSVDSGDDRSSTAGVGPNWALIPGPASALIDRGAIRADLVLVEEFSEGDMPGADVFGEVGGTSFAALIVVGRALSPSSTAFPQSSSPSIASLQVAARSDASMTRC